MRSRITHKIYRSFALVLISIKMSNTRIIDSKIELPFNRLAIWLMREQIVTEPIWRPSHPSRVRGLKWIYPWTVVRLLLRRTLHGCVDWNWSSVRVSLYFDTVAPFTGAWIEIAYRFFGQNLFHSRTLHGCVDWNFTKRGGRCGRKTCRTLHGCVDWNLEDAFNDGQLVQSHPSRVRGLK